MNIHVGTSGFGYKEWKGSFYPAGIPSGEMLRFYAEQFFTVEINNTFYRMPAEDTLASWSEQVPQKFIFAFKAPRIITHIKRLRNVESEAGYFFRTLSVLGKKLGPVLFQFPKSFHPDFPVLKDFLDLIPVHVSCAFEFRSRSPLDNEIMKLLQKHGCSLCISDSDEAPADKIIRTAPWGYLRLRKTAYTDAGLSEWTERILSQKWKEAFVFFKHSEGARPETALRFHKFAGPGIVKSR